MVVWLLISRLSVATPPDEGMWLPIFIQALNYDDMRAKGLKLTAEQIYSANQSSLKDAVVLFGGGCTGEIISEEGLLLTNHHCGYAQIQSHSSVEKDYLRNGFWAKNKDEELPNDGLKVTFIVRIEDVTQQVLSGVTPEMTENQRQAEIERKIKEISKGIEKDSHYEAVIKPFYYGSEYYLFVTETFKDVRLVGTPPDGIGKFGGDTDNWMWPRHTGDFSLFRVYANKDNKPAAYSKENVPYKPKHFFPISLKGIKEGDFTMILGFPGRTQEYLTSYAVELLVEKTNPYRIALREKRLEIINSAMQASDEIRIKYAAEQASIANAYKKWIGENRGLKKMDALQRKRDLEGQFVNWCAQDETRKQRYAQVLPDLAKHYQTLEKVNLAELYINEAVFGADILYLAYQFTAFVDKFSDKELDKIKRRVEGHFKNYDANIDRQLLAVCLQAYYNDIPQALHPAVYAKIQNEFQGDFARYAQYIFDNSLLASKEKASAVLANFTALDLEKIINDPAVELFRQFLEKYLRQVEPIFDQTMAEIDPLMRQYVAGLREMQTDRKFYPDANSTMRLTYGTVAGYNPEPNQRYEYFTTLDQIIEKGKQANQVADYFVPEKLQQLYDARDFGRYADGGTVRTCFIASNHTTGGNSGSPVLNAEGHLVGINFDRNWEGTMSDVMYDPTQVRNITADIRYILFIIDKYAEAGYLINEMKIIE
ncbi:MAG TPA: serine protease [Microscillaceae bacterium]|jgi:hypothetical protein|nr:serine protease [Microscillaceae bacterium]